MDIGAEEGPRKDGWVVKDDLSECGYVGRQERVEKKNMLCGPHTTWNGRAGKLCTEH